MKHIIKCIIGWFLSIIYNRKKNQLYFIIWGHIGEAVYASSLLPELKRIKKRKINILTFSPYSQVAELYSNYCEKIIVLSRRKIDFILTYSQSHICKYDNYIGGGWQWEDNSLYLDIPDVYVAGLNYKIKDLKIPYSTKHSLITNPVSSDEKEFISLIDSLNVIKGKSVLLIPYAQSAKEMPVDFWISIARILRELGYNVYTNIKDNTESPIKGTIPAIIPLKYVITFIQYAGSAISIRCGLTDLIAVSDSDVEIIYKVENDIDNMLVGIWSFKLGKENLLYRNKWVISNREDEKNFEDYIKNKYQGEM